MRFLFPITFLFCASLVSGAPPSAQNSGDRAKGDGPENEGGEKQGPELSDGIPTKLEISRQHIVNFLTDETALLPYRSGGEEVRDLDETFMIGSPGGRFAAVWDPVVCRLIGVIDLEFSPPEAPETPETRNEEEDLQDDAEPAPPSPYVLQATGPAPFSRAAEAFGSPGYFAMRLASGGRPEFLFLHGGLAIEEQLWFENGGEVLLQRFSIREPTSTVVLTIPEEWMERATSAVGEWDRNTLIVPEEEAGEIILSFRLTPMNPESEEKN